MTSPRRLGIALVLVSALLWSTAGPFIRMADLDIWSVVFWRSLATAATMAAWMALRPNRRGERRGFGLPGVLSTLIATGAAVAYVAALTWTTVANVMTIYAALPILAGLIGWLWLRERLSLRFWLAGGVAAGGVAVMMGGGFGARDWLGIATATAMTTAFATQLVIARRYPRLDSTMMIALSALICALIAWPMMPPGLPSARALVACGLYGMLSTGLGYILVLIGGRLIGAGEAAFLSLIDVVLGPVWVWMFFGEVVGGPTILGGGLVLGAVAWYLATADKPLPRPRDLGPPTALDCPAPGP